VPVLIEALKDESSAVRSSAANTLGIIGSPAKAALPELIRLSADSDETVRAAATEAAGKVQAGREMKLLRGHGGLARRAKSVLPAAQSCSG